MNITLDMVDELIRRSSASYDDAKKALQDSDGDVEKALAALAEKKAAANYDANKFDDVLSQIRTAIEKGTAARFVIKKGDEVVVNIPAVVGLVGLWNPFLSAAGIGAAIMTGHTLTVENKDGSKVVLNEYIDKAVDKVKDVGEDIAGHFKEEVKKPEAENKTI